VGVAEHHDVRFGSPLDDRRCRAPLQIAPSTLGGWRERELLHAAVAEAQVLRGFALSGLSGVEIDRVTRAPGARFFGTWHAGAGRAAGLAALRLLLWSYARSDAEVVLDPRFSGGQPVFARTKVRPRAVMVRG